MSRDHKGRIVVDFNLTMKHENFKQLSFDKKLNELHRLALILIQGETAIMTTQADIDAHAAALNAKLTSLTNAEHAHIVYTHDILNQLDAVRAQLAADHPNLDLSALDALGAGIDANAAAAAAAVVANTPASPTAPATPAAPAADPHAPLNMTPAAPDAPAAPATPSYVATGSAQTWDGTKATAEDPLGGAVIPAAPAADPHAALNMTPAAPDAHAKA